MTQARALWTVGPGRMDLRAETLPPVGADVLRLRARHSGVSRGTEALVLAGRVPESEHDRMRAPLQEGSFPFPVKYGYALVGDVEVGPPEMIGRTVFALHPHQDRADVPADMAVPLPDGLPPRRAVLGANMETALNVVWDAGAGPGDRVLVVGAGVVGLLTAALLAAMPGTEVTVCDLDAGRAPLARRLGAGFAGPGDVPGDQDVAINLSASASGLQTALDALACEGRAVEASWHGAGTTPVALGGAFHSRRLSLVSSQVGLIPPDRARRWSHARRLAKALDLLAARPDLDALISHDIAFADAPDALPPLLAPGVSALCPCLTYPETGET